MSQLVLLDWVIVLFYFAAVFGIAFWVIRQKQKSTADYFLAGKNVGWFVVGASLFASNIGSEHLVGLAGAGAESGVVFGHLEFQASIVLLLLGWVFVPFYARSGVFTMPEFLERRYSQAARWYLSIISVVGYVLTKICVTIYAGGVVFETLMGIDFWTGAIAIVVLTGIYTVIGGLRAVIYTEVMQTGVLIAGAIAVTAIGLARIGGWSALYEVVGSDYFNAWKPVSHPNYPWTGMIFGAPIIAIWYWCTDQYIVQRTAEGFAEFSALTFTMLGYDEPRRVRAGIVSGNYFGFSCRFGGSDLCWRAWPMDAAAIVENAGNSGGERRLGKGCEHVQTWSGVFHNRLENASRFPRAPTGPS